LVQGKPTVRRGRSKAAIARGLGIGRTSVRRILEARAM
jgi:hypothetical protein